MKTITLEAYNEVKAQNRESVTKALKSFLQREVVSLAKNTIVEISSNDFCKNEDFHYYNCKKMTDVEFDKALDVKYILHGKGRSSMILVKVL